jgi:DNA-binding transcriptional ArsR family regulator
MASVVVELAVEGWLCRRLHVARVVTPKPAAAVMCALCGSRPGTLPDVIDARRVLVCAPCRDGEVAEPEVLTTRDRILAVLRRSDGIEIAELAEALGEDDQLGRCKVSAALNRAVDAGLVTFTGRKNDRVYSLVRR